MDAPTLTGIDGKPNRRLAHLYFSPIVHCPALCPFGPPRELFSDDYSWAREEAAASHCGRHCGMAADEPPCLQRHADPSVREPDRAVRSVDSGSRGTDWNGD